MSFRLSAAPPDGIEQIKLALSQIAPNGAVWKALHGVDAIAVPHAVWEVEPKHIAGGEGFGRARRVAFRYLLLQKGEPIAAAELTIRDERKPARFGGFNIGPFVLGTEKAISAAETRLGKTHVFYELNVVRIPALNVVALWLRTDHPPGETPVVVGGALHPEHVVGLGNPVLVDRIVPMDPSPSPLQVHRLYGVELFCKQLKKPASQELPDLRPK